MSSDWSPSYVKYFSPAMRVRSESHEAVVVDDETVVEVVSNRKWDVEWNKHRLRGFKRCEGGTT